MQISTTVSDLDRNLGLERQIGRKIGFVPTMGALHEGHLSLIKKALIENDSVVCSIFVNPTQFNNVNDLINYPRMPETDLAWLNEAGCHYVFLPETNEIYQPGEPLLDIDFGHLEKTMEGYFRPGHFIGVVTVVDKLFRMVSPSKAYFGEKDFQQLAIIRRMAQILKHTVEIIGCPTLREHDGLAMSSRNLLLTEGQRKEAPLIYKAISDAGLLIQQGELLSEVKKWVTDMLNASRFLKVQYFEVVHPDTLDNISDDEIIKEARGCIAVITDGPRLIDNVAYRY